jgi:hypothetical protein
LIAPDAIRTGDTWGLAALRRARPLDVSRGSHPTAAFDRTRIHESLTATMQTLHSIALWEGPNPLRVRFPPGRPRPARRTCLAAVKGAQPAGARDDSHAPGSRASSDDDGSSPPRTDASPSGKRLGFPRDSAEPLTTRRLNRLRIHCVRRCLEGAGCVGGVLAVQIRGQDCLRQARARGNGPPESLRSIGNNLATALATSARCQHNLGLVSQRCN